MAITFYTNNGSNNPLFYQAFEIYGDGATTSLNIDLEAAPVGLVFERHNRPTYVVVASHTGPSVSSATISGSVLSITWSSAPASVPGVGAEVVVNFGYPGV